MGSFRLLLLLLLLVGNVLQIQWKLCQASRRVCVNVLNGEAGLSLSLSSFSVFALSK